MREQYLHQNVIEKARMIEEINPDSQFIKSQNDINKLNARATIIIMYAINVCCTSAFMPIDAFAIDPIGPCKARPGPMKFHRLNYFKSANIKQALLPKTWMKIVVRMQCIAALRQTAEL